MNTNKHSIAISIGGFGDLFVMCGMINYYSYLSHIDKVYVIPFLTQSKRSLSNTVTKLFEDNQKIEIIKWPSDLSRYPLQNFINGINNIINRPDHIIQYPHDLNQPSQYKNTAVLWDEQIYTLQDLPFSTRYRSFALPTDLSESKLLYDKLVKKEQYIITHREIGTQIDKIPIDIHYWRKQAGLDPIENYQIIDIDASLTDNMIHYVELIKNAKEIHCAPSSFFCLVDSITSLTDAKLFLHMVRKNFHMRINNHFNNNRWCLINYDETFLK